MKIVFVAGGWIRVPPQKGGGAEAFILNLAKQLTKMGHEVTLLDRKYDNNDRDVEYIEEIKIVRLKSARIKHFSFTINFVLTQILFGLQVNKWLKKVDYLNIHVYNVVLGLVVALRSKKIRNRLFYTSIGLRRDKVIPSFTDRVAYVLENNLVRMAKKTTIANEITARKLVEQARVKPEKVQVIPIGVDIEQFRPDHDTSLVSNKYDLKGKRNILFVGRICFEKGVEYLVKAADILVNQLGEKNVQFLIVGPREQFDPKRNVISSYTAKMINLVNERKLHRIMQFTGAVPIDDLTKLYSACDMVLIPSIVDLDPQVQIEAMASGKPVIGTNIGTMPRRIVDGMSGFIVVPANEQQLALKIKYILDNPAEMRKMGDYARRLVDEKYSSNMMAERMLHVFDLVSGDNF